jgi:transposase
VGRSEAHDRILDLTNKGMTTGEVAKHLSRSTTLVQQYKTDLRHDGLLPNYVAAPHNDLVLQMAREGRKAREIAAATGLNAGTVQGRLNRFRAKGLIPRAAVRKRNNSSAAMEAYLLKKAYTQFGGQLGKLGLLVATMPPWQVQWLMGQVPKDGKLIEVLRGVIADAYSEERGGLGKLGLLLATMPKEQAKWLMDQVPSGGKLIDVLRGIITDAYLEEIGE